jgi:hypothetical protein
LFHLTYCITALLMISELPVASVLVVMALVTQNRLYMSQFEAIILVNTLLDALGAAADI